MMEPYQQFEKSWAAFNNLDPAGMVACSSGTAALHLALEALQLPLGSKVIVPDFTMIACARAVVLAGLTPVFVDCGDDLNMDLDLLSAKASREVRAVMAVHVYGRQVDMNHLLKIATGCNWFVVEDLAEAHGVKPHPETDAACWSFYRNKVVAGEEGGAVWFKNPQAAYLARQLRSLGFTEAHDFRHVPRGHNYRMSNTHAELVLKGLDKYRYPYVACLKGPDASNDGYSLRREIEQWYDDACPLAWRMPRRDVPWVYDLRIEGMVFESQNRVVKALNEAGIAARHAFKPMHEQEEFLDCQFIKSGSGRSRSSYFAALILYLPIQPGITTEKSIIKAFAIIRDFFPE